jgi:hypothetical protein
MSDDESKIRTLIERWARAAQAGDIEGVLVDHTPCDARGSEILPPTWFFDPSGALVLYEPG